MRLANLLGRFVFVAALLCAGLGAARAQPLNYQDLWWGGSQENGWGLSINQQGDAIFAVLYIYDATGRPEWVVMPAGSWNGAKDAYTGALYITSGSSFASYDPTRLVVGASVGEATIAFTGSSTARLSYTIRGVAGTKNIARQSFGAGAAIGNLSDLWWGGASQNGWGLSLTQQGSAVFGVWYTYDATGRPTWFVMPAGSIAANVVTGTLYRTSGSAWVGAAYDASRLQVASVGNLTLTLGDASSAQMRWSVEGVEGTVNIRRQPFGNAAAVSGSSFAKLQERVLGPACVSCHTAGHAYAVQSGLVLDGPVAYRNLVEGLSRLGTAAANGISRLVAPRDPSRSFLHRKLLLWDPAQAGNLGSPMPLGNTSLTLGQLEFIKRWIEVGAPETGEVVDPKLLDDAQLPAYAPFAPLTPPAAGKGFQLRVDPFQVQPHFERELFVYRSLGNSEPVYVNRFETRMRPNSHHLLLYDFDASTPALAFPAKDVVRDIRNADGSLNFLNMLPMAYHVFFGGSMTPNGGYAFLPGVALRLPANAALDFNLHYVNHSGSLLTGEAYANLHTIPASEVQHVARPINLPNTAIDLPPRQRTTHTRNFVFQTRTHVLALTSHMHKLGERFVIRISGGPRDGEVVYDNSDWEHPAMVTFATPIVLEPGQGLTSIITWNNTTDRTVGFGLTSEDEMGIIFGYHY